MMNQIVQSNPKFFLGLAAFSDVGGLSFGLAQLDGHLVAVVVATLMVVDDDWKWKLRLCSIWFTLFFCYAIFV
ncbi:hypothetical protein SOVF_110150 [Spinacia oleracea]|nr:hypothetical protein SOVF_110150 [Spinacia oleracea]